MVRRIIPNSWLRLRTKVGYWVGTMPTEKCHSSTIVVILKNEYLLPDPEISIMCVLWVVYFALGHKCQKKIFNINKMWIQIEFKEVGYFIHKWSKGRPFMS